MGFCKKYCLVTLLALFRISRDTPRVLNAVPAWETVNNDDGDSYPNSPFPIQ
jgi:hypothetical protein